MVFLDLIYSFKTFLIFKFFDVLFYLRDVCSQTTLKILFKNIGFRTAWKTLYIVVFLVVKYSFKTFLPNKLYYISLCLRDPMLFQ